MKYFNARKNFNYLYVFAIAAAISGLTACKKDSSSNSEVIKPVAYVSITNALDGSLAQDLYLDNVKINLSAQAVAYGQTSGYLTSTQGQHSGNFANTNTTTATGSINIIFNALQYYSLYYTGTGSTATVATPDDLTAPAAGKAKVRFLQLSPALTTGVDFGVSASSKLATNLAYRAYSDYYTVDANTTFFLYATGSTTAILSIPVTIQAGKIYAIYISGSTTASLKYNIAAQN